MAAVGDDPPVDAGGGWPDLVNQGRLHPELEEVRAAALDEHAVRDPHRKVDGDDPDGCCIQAALDALVVQKADVRGEGVGELVLWLEQDVAVTDVGATVAGLVRVQPLLARRADVEDAASGVDPPGAVDQALCPHPVDDARLVVREVGVLRARVGEQHLGGGLHDVRVRLVLAMNASVWSF